MENKVRNGSLTGSEGLS